MAVPAGGLRERFVDSARALRDVMREPQLRRAELAYALACTADWALTVVLGVVAFRDGGAAAVGLVTIFRMVPSAVASPFLTAVADRMHRGRVLATVSTIHAGVVAAAGVFLEIGASTALVYAAAAIATTVLTIFRPTHSALLPSLCKTTTELASANVVRGLFEAVATLLGPIVAGVLLAAVDPTAVFVAISILSAGAALTMLRVQYQPLKAIASEAARQRGTALQEAVAGVRAVTSHRELATIFGLVFAQTALRGAMNVFIVVVAFDLLDLRDTGVAIFSAALGVGGLLGSLGVSLLVGSRHLGAWLAIALAAWGTPIALIGVVPVAPAVFGFLCIVGLANAIFDVPVFTLPVRLAPDATLARAFGVLEGIISIGIGLGSIVTPGLVGLLGLRPAVIVTGLVLPALALAFGPRLAALDARLGVRDEEIKVLRSTPMLGLLPVPSIEHLASRLRRVEFPAGSVVLHQGDAGDSFYVISTGEAAVVGDGGVRRTLGPGESFGEIALLHEVPRTATVRAETELVVFEFEREAFLDAVASHGASTDAAHAVVARHLANFRPAGLTI